ncbi:hypothetical protein B0H11DRAFT_2233469 [Mycena galericulata]|nr:hypothetical protein B0H11DRAFT_2233469 [Mycena galericulata]
MSSSTEIPVEDNMSFWNIRNLKFRVLILGRANAGKTTILERLMGSPMLPDQIVRGQNNRGEHDVEDEIYFSTKPGFVFHDSCGVEAGSAKELSVIKQFVEHRSFVRNSSKQLHAIWMCFPLDESRELFEGEKAFFHWEKGAVALVVIFTKRDGAVLKETSRIIEETLEGSQEHTITRSIRKEARQRAELQVTKHVNALEQELRSLSMPNSSIAFLTTSGMEEQTVETDQACQQLINLTKECLTEPRLKALLAMVWGRNLSWFRSWCLHGILEGNHGK